MSRVYKTARGRVLDMDKVKLANESVTAIGNMKINARGDKLGPGGKIQAGRNQIMDQVYATSTGGYSPNDPETFKENQERMSNNKAKELAELASNLVQSTTEQEASEQQETTQAARGNLASAVAKTATVTQEPMRVPRKNNNGPSRI